MNRRSAIAAALTMILAVSAAFADAAATASAVPASGKPPAAAAADEAKVKEIKDILFKLVRQDEYLDETIDTLDSSNKKLSLHELTALGLSLKVIKGNLNAISAMNKKQFSEIQPNEGLTTYTKTILSYSRSISRKIAKVAGLVSAASSGNKKREMRDAPSSRNGKKNGNGKKLSQLLEEQQAMKRLSADIQLLKISSQKLTATSNWLYLVSK